MKEKLTKLKHTETLSGLTTGDLRNALDSVNGMSTFKALGNTHDSDSDFNSPNVNSSFASLPVLIFLSWFRTPERDESLLQESTLFPAVKS